jgi:late competence protein required for DNA uptake (superfamily II DNA/RNA helicase)
MAAHGRGNDESPPILIRVPSSVVYAANPDATPDTMPNEKIGQVHSETDSREEAKVEFKEGGYGW